MTVSISIDQTDEGHFRAKLADREIEATTLAQLLHDLGKELFEVFSPGELDDDSAGPEDSAEFEADLDHTLTKNAELYRRLAR